MTLVCVGSISATVGPALTGFYGDHNMVEQARRRYYLDAVAPQDSFYGDMIPVPNLPAAGLAPPVHNGWVPMMAREATEPLPDAPAAPAAAPAPPAAPTTAAPASDTKREQGWAEWLGLRAHTVTSTIVRFATTT